MFHYLEELMITFYVVHKRFYISVHVNYSSYAVEEVITETERTTTVRTTTAIHRTETTTAITTTRPSTKTVTTTKRRPSTTTSTTTKRPSTTRHSMTTKGASENADDSGDDQIQNVIEGLVL